MARETRTAQQIEKDFLKLAQEARSAAGIRRRGPQTREWFRNNILDLFGKYTPNKRTNILKGDTRDLLGKQAKKFPGRMYMYFYDPKTKKDLPYYDLFPLVFILEIYDDGFLGINLHYLPPDLRAVLFSKLITVVNNKKYDDTTKLRLSYKLIKGFSRYRFAEPAIKRYLTTHIRSQIKLVPAEHWELAIFLPTETFRKQIKEVVWNDSRKKVNQGKQRY